MTVDRDSLDPAEFDRFRDTYENDLNRAVSFAGQDADVYMEVKADVLVDLARRHVGDPSRLDFLDVGCGTGATDRHLVSRVGSVTGVDISAGMIDRARAAVPAAAYSTYNGSRLPQDDESFDVVFAVCVVHHVPQSSWGGFVAEMMRVTRRGGLVAIAEHNPLNPVTRVIVNKCAFDEDAVLLGSRTARNLLKGTGLKPVEVRNILFVPWRTDIVERVERLLRRAPLGAQYVAAGRRV